MYHINIRAKVASDIHFFTKPSKLIGEYAGPFAGARRTGRLFRLAGDILKNHAKPLPTFARTKGIAEIPFLGRRMDHLKTVRNPG